MDKAAKRRWAVWISLLAATVAAIFAPSKEAGVPAAVDGRKEAARAPLLAGVPRAGSAPALKPGALPKLGADAVAGGAGTAGASGIAGSGGESGESEQPARPDPFGPRDWKPPAPPVPAPAAVAAVQETAPPVPSGPPPLPFRFLGRMTEDGKQVVYLSLRDQAIVAAEGETVGEQYKIVSIDNQKVEFEYLPSGEKQELSIASSDN